MLFPWVYSAPLRSGGTPNRKNPHNLDAPTTTLLQHEIVHDQLLVVRHFDDKENEFKI